MEVRTGYAEANNISIYYEDMGEQHHPAILLVCGMSVQLIHWPDDFCQKLVAQGYRVIRFDNRETGLTTRSHVKVPPPVMQSFIRFRLGMEVHAEYNLDTLVLDAVSLLDALDIQQAHWVGFSMGGMIAQLAAAHYQQRVLSLTSIMSSTNERHLPGARWDVLLAILNRPKDKSEKAIVDAGVAVFNKLQSPKYKVHDDVLAFDVRRAIARARRPMAGAMHQMAIFSTGGFSKRLKQISVPTLVIHGDRDLLVRLQGGKHSAKSIPNASLEIIPGMGHDFPPGLIGKLTGLIMGHVSASAPVAGVS
ncbi:hypothetical protein A9Q81_21595 [Gammaproteobacteria bacterium 42_54_T18]|nr:hypothetical protein A9Q81_21595 [Gammaproteobacteria bacterium 42_54_T18]